MKRLSQALWQADEYRREVRPEIRAQLRATIETLVGRWVDGRLVLPEIVREAMGVTAYEIIKACDACGATVEGEDDILCSTCKPASTGLGAA
jgi:hypothetical protein